jgi:ABC-type Fe3+/spermidine/putrescine transport system ATPase subunit
MEIQVDGITLLAGKKEGVLMGDSVSLAIRLERVKRVDQGRKEDFDNLMSGEVEDVVFFGFVVKYYVRISDALLIIAEEEISEDEQKEEVSIGMKMTIGFSIRDVNLFVERMRPSMH